MDLIYNVLNDVSKTRVVKFYKSLDRQITKNLKDSEIITRPVKTNGLWCFVLLPTILLANTWLYNVTYVYRMTAYISIGLLFYCMLLTIFLSVSCLILTETIFAGCTASSFIASLLLYGILDENLLVSFVLPFASVFMNYYLLRFALTKLPKTFTFGEAIIVTQGIVLFTTMSICKMLYEDTKPDFVNAIVYTTFAVVGAMITAIFSLKKDERHLLALSYIMMTGGGFMIALLHAMLGTGFLMDFVSYIFIQENRLYLILFWALLVTVAVFIIVVRLRHGVKANTVTRKSFHVLASLVFMCGILTDVELMRLAAGVGLAAVIFVEALRKAGIPYVSRPLQNAFNLYCDDKDCGTFALTPIYLFIGLSCPLLLVPWPSGAAAREAGRLERLCGVLAIGLGDSAASAASVRDNNSKWPGSDKTLEGTAFNIVTQIVVVYALDAAELLNTNNALARATAAALASGLVEAQTRQVDNLVLPLVSLIALQAAEIAARAGFTVFGGHTVV